MVEHEGRDGARTEEGDAHGAVADEVGGGGGVEVADKVRVQGEVVVERNEAGRREARERSQRLPVAVGVLVSGRTLVVVATYVKRTRDSRQVPTGCTPMTVGEHPPTETAPPFIVKFRCH